MSAPLDEHTFTQLCAAVIGIPAIRPTDHFFEAGGDSLSAARLAVLVDEEWQLRLDIFDIMTAGSIREIHARLTRRPDQPPASENDATGQRCATT